METVQNVQTTIEPECTKSTELSPENGREQVQRDATGKLMAGHQGLPGAGRPQSIAEAYRHILRRDGPLKYAEVIAQDALTADKARDRLAAFAEITDRVDGKAVQNIRHAGVFMVMAPSADALQALDSWSESE